MLNHFNTSFELPYLELAVCKTKIVLDNITYILKPQTVLKFVYIVTATSVDYV